MLSTVQREELRLITNSALDVAEAVWEQTGAQMRALAASALEENLAKSFPSAIPGHPMVNEVEPEVDDFICMMLDIRNSTRHLNEIDGRCGVQQIQRVLYETSALLHPCARVVQYDGGNVTEYLGDGALALFKVPSDTDSACYACYRAANNILTVTKEIVNAILAERYHLPPLKIGIGMALSKAIVTVIGLPGNRIPKVIGQCVYRASKLCNGEDQVVVDKFLYEAWPQEKGGSLHFTKWAAKDKGIEGFLITK